MLSEIAVSAPGAKKRHGEKARHSIRSQAAYFAVAACGSLSHSLPPVSAAARTLCSRLLSLLHLRVYSQPATPLSLSVVYLPLTSLALTRLVCSAIIQSFTPPLPVIELPLCSVLSTFTYSLFTLCYLFYVHYPLTLLKPSSKHVYRPFSVRLPRWRSLHPCSLLCQHVDLSIQPCQGK